MTLRYIHTKPVTSSQSDCRLFLLLFNSDDQLETVSCSVALWLLLWPYLAVKSGVVVCFLIRVTRVRWVYVVSSMTAGLATQREEPISASLDRKPCAIEPGAGSSTDRRSQGYSRTCRTRWPVSSADRWDDSRCRGRGTECTR